MKSFGSSLAKFVVAAFGPSVCLGQNILIVNPGFESPAIGACAFRGLVLATDGWEDVVGGQCGLWRPSTCWDMGAQEGVQVAYSNGGAARQVLATNAIPSTVYTLSASVGTRNHPCCTARTVTLELWAGGARFGIRTILPAEVPPPAHWQTYSLVATTPPVLAPNSKLEIRFSATGAQADFDSFRLTLGDSSCPADLNNDGVVDDADFILFAAAYNILDCGDPAMPPGCPADIDGNTFVDDADFVAFAAAYNELICP